MKQINIFRQIIADPFHPRSSRAITGFLVSLVAGLITISLITEIYRRVAGH